MEKHSVCQVIIVDWDSRQYATIDASADKEDWDRKVGAEKEKGRDVHCFSHDAGDTSGLMNWAKQQRLTQTDVPSIMSTT